jgi:crotonobetainyl-CoA:carnitine CoA-transferase CaiB-like acyl-CoA transferase
VPHQRLFHYEDVIADEEAYENDALRMVEYKAFGERSLPTSPVRFGSYGDPPIILSKPLGYHTREYLERFGYTAEQIGELEAEGAVRCWAGESIPDRVFLSRRQLSEEAGGSGSSAGS